MSPMDKMWASFVAIGLMAGASFLISYARNRTRGVIRIILSIIAFLMFVPILLYMVVSIL
ncbi:MULTISPECIES: DUF2768 family protein [Paenibacillus]|jgi:magnesium-transporting ATPase (P-type)|uniref:DUF2768 family protein n=1 Tax=Paenibacillus baimaensis TaxID=2982185 RepID=A0ABT2UP46_9BACL|nr:MULTISPECIES: DUF2768 family protein [unclassified Paenibacillus]MCU6795846.1 DUF2768 family protein [Paenibacillus sp. WQ 127069]OMF20658.1 DUF2768 domain-containing protein [Paenibacillus sp. FSL H7-0331]